MDQMTYFQVDAHSVVDKNILSAQIKG